MTYDDWKTESPEDEDERLNGPAPARAHPALAPFPPNAAPPRVWHGTLKGQA